MKHIKLFLIAALLLVASSVWAYDFEVDGIYYAIISSNEPYEVSVVNNHNQANSYSGQVVIPEHVYYDGINYTVTTIGGAYGYGHGAFWNCTEPVFVEMPITIRSIDMGAFQYCTGLTTLTIPQSVEYIGRGAFMGCSALTMVNYNANNCTFDHNASNLPVFSNCTSVATLNIGNGVEVIPENAFRGMTGLSSVSISNTVTSIGKGAFSGCITAPASISIPDSVTSIGEGVFFNCTGLTSVIIPNSVTSIGRKAFANCTSLTNINFPEFLTDIGVEAFQNCSGLTSISFPNFLINIERSAFSDCIGLTIISLPSSLSRINAMTFKGCKGLTSITIPNSVTSIDNEAFCGCSNLASIGFPNSLTDIGDDAFFACTNLASLYIPGSVVYICPNAFRGCSSLNTISVDPNNHVYDSRDNCNAIIETQYNTLACGCKNTVIPNSITDIGSDAFYGCMGLTSIVIPNTVTTIWAHPFANCPNLVSIIVESGNPIYDSRNNCNAIIESASNTLECGCKNTIIPNSVTEIGYGAFYDCTSITSVSIPNSVTCIGNFAFKGCIGLITIAIPNSVISIGASAFEDTGLYNDENHWENNVLYISGCLIEARYGVETNYEVKEGTRLIANGAFSGRSVLTSISIPISVTIIGKDSFYGCNRMTRICLPKYLTSIGDCAFYNCENLADAVVYSNVPPTLGDRAFSGCEGIQLYVPCGSGEAYANAQNWSLFTNIIETDLSYSVEVLANDESLGYVQVSQQPDCENHLATVLAEPINGNVFLNWTVDGQVVSTTNPYTFVVENDVELVAVFSGTSIDEETAREVSVSPNPAHDRVNIICEEMRNIRLFSLDGHRVKTINAMGANEMEIDFSGMAKGLYMLRIETKNGKLINRKIIVQ